MLAAKLVAFLYAVIGGGGGMGGDGEDEGMGKTLQFGETLCNEIKFYWTSWKSLTSRSPVSSKYSKVAPSREGQNKNNAGAVRYHGQTDPTARGVQVAGDIESDDIEQGTTGRQTNTSFRRTKSFIAENKLNEQVESYGLAVLSIVDMITDIIMITKYHAEGRQDLVTTSTICVSLCLATQSFMVYGQNAKKSKSRARQVKEQLIVFSLLNSGVDA